MENDIPQKKDPFPKTVSNMYHVLAGWKNSFNSKYYWLSDENDGIAFATMMKTMSLHFRNMTSCVIFKMKQRFQKGGYSWTASRQ